ncbi:MAG TPA: DUF3574 domain-containing protein [Micropepsaceae bacterium]|nr:DUF3574 domain-containing protein [Micropepsaceae bacterium]
MLAHYRQSRQSATVLRLRESVELAFAKSLAFAAIVMLAGCAAGTPQACAPGLSHMIQADLFFGRAVTGRAMVSDEDWRGFLDEEVTPRFPAGFSVEDAYGQYRNGAGNIAREQSKHLIVVTAGGADDQARLNAIREAYKRRFMQESILLAQTPMCAGF